MNSSTSSSKRFFGGALAGAAALFTLTLATSETLLRREAVPQDAFFQQLALYNNVHKADIVAFGDSHMSQGFDMPEGGLNLAFAAESFEQISFKLRAYLKTHEKPRLVILQMEPHMFADYRYLAPARDYAAFFGNKPSLQTHYRVLDPLYRSELPQIWQSFLLHGPLQQKNLLTPQGTMLLSVTWTMPMSPQMEQGLDARVKDHVLSANFTARGTDAVMRDTLRLLKKEKIPACIIGFPTAPIYREKIARDPQTALARETIRKLVRDEGQPYFSYLTLYDDYALYRNPDHLNAKGARLFAARVLKDCGWKGPVKY